MGTHVIPIWVSTGAVSGVPGVVEPEATAEHAHRMACSINRRSHLVRTDLRLNVVIQTLQGRRIRCSARPP